MWLSVCTNSPVLSLARDVRVLDMQQAEVGVPNTLELNNDNFVYQEGELSWQLNHVHQIKIKWNKLLKG